MAQDLIVMSGTGGGGISKWSDLQGASADLTLANTTFNTTFNQTSAVSWTWSNLTAAVAGTNQDSPILNLKSTYWDNTTSQVDTWSLQTRTSGAGSGGAVGNISTGITAYSITSNVITFTGPGTNNLWLLKPDGTNNGTFTVSGATGGNAFINGTYTLIAVNAANVTAALTHANTSASGLTGITAQMYVQPASLLYIKHTGSAGTAGSNISGVVFPSSIQDGSNRVTMLPIMFAGSTGTGGEGGIVQAGIGSAAGSQPSLQFYAGTSGGTFTFNSWASNNGIPTTVGSLGFVATGFNLSAQRSSDPMCIGWANTFTNANNAGLQIGHPTAGGFTTTTGSVQYAVMMGKAPSALVTDIVFRPTSGAVKFVGCAVHPTINQTGTASGDYTAFEVDVLETAVTGTNKLLLDLRIGGTTKLKVDNAGTVYPSGQSVKWLSGSGTPESNITAPVGSLYTRTDGGTGTTLYVKETGTGNTGWVAK